ncbi:MAG: FG-GAP-like repeat-containing protein, partial [Verrucomicrobiota bacterium]
MSILLEGSDTELASSNSGALNYTVTTDGVHYVRLQTDNRQLRAQYYLHAIVTDGTAPVVSTVSLPAESGSSSAVLDRVRVQFSEQPEPVLSRIGRNYLTYNGHVYFATSSSKTWVSAEAEAQGLGGHLVTINDAAENEWVRQNFNYLSTVWIGFNDQAAEGTFVWASGESSDFTNWQGGEPNNSGDEDFASMYTSGAWNDAGPGQSYFGVIEVSGTDTDGDGLPDAADPYPTDRLNAFDLRAAGADGNFDTADDQLYSLASVGYDGGLSATFVVVDGPLQPGNYRFTVTTALKDRAGNPLATAFVRHFTVNNVPGFVLENRANDSQVTATPLGSAGTGADGSFFNRGTYGAGSNPYFVTAGHFNADTQPDLAVANISSGNVTVYIGRGSGLYHSGVYYPSGNGPIALAVGDFNADSKSDLAVANYYGSTMSVLLGNGDGTFQTATSYGTDVNPRSVVTADFNGDGKPDLATANQSRANVSIFLGNGDGTFQNGVHFPAANGPHSIAAADLNKDNKTDLVVVNTSSDNVSILLGQGDGTFPAPVNYAVQNAPRSVAIGDVNGDTKLDLTVLNAGVNPNSVSVLLGNDDGTFANAIHYPIEGGDPYQVILTTVNADGALDVVVASYGSGRLVFLFNNGDGTFGGSVSHYIPGNPISVVAGDFSGDGIMDLATGNYGHSNMNVLTGNRPTLLAEDPAGTGVRSGFGRGNLTDREDWDFWSFSGNAGDLLSVAVEIPNSPPASQLYYRIDYPDGERFFDFYASSYNGWGESRPNSPPLVLPKSGTYTVRVSYNYDYFGEYRLRVTLARPPMQMESEDNNNLNQADAPALTLATGRQTASVLGYIGVGDPEGDFFRLGNLAAGTTITLGLTQPSTSGLAGVLSIYNSSGANVATSAAGASSLEFTVPAEGDDAYYARVTSAGPKHVTGSSTPLSFDGGDDYVDLGAWSPGNRWTVSAWVRPAGYDSRRRNIVGGYADCRDWGITLQNGDFGVVIRQPGGCSQTVPSGITPSLGTWYHVLATSDGTTAKIYVNGSLRNSAAVDPEYIGTPNGTRIGGEVCCGGNNFPGLIDEVSIWDRALSDEEVTSLFITALEGTESGLVGYWKLNEGTGTTVADRSTQSRNGTLANGAAWVSVGAATATPAGLLSQYILSIELADTLPPSLVGDNLPKEGSSNPVFLDRFSLSFSEDMLATSVNDSASYDLRSAGADGNFDTGDDELYTVVSNGYSSGLSAGYTIGDGPLQPGNYRFTAKTTLKDRAENPLSSAYVRQFSIAGVNGFIGENRNNNTPGTATSISPAPGTSPDGSFAAGSNFGAANNPYFVSAAMLNNDAFLDLVVANYGSDNLSVLLGNGDGTFQTRVNYGAGNGPLALAVADLNQDGKLDVISGNHNSRNISVLLGNGDGTLQTPVNYNVGNNPRSVAVGDVNGDNMLDVAVANQNTANVSVLLGNGDGTLQAAVNHATGNGPHGVALRDVNGDNKLDLAVVNVSSDTMSVLLGNGDATFQAPVNYPTDNAPRSVAVGDVNSDSKLDLVVVTSSNPNYLNVFLGNGDGTFADRVSYATGGSDPYHLVLVDLNNDSKLDGVVANYGASRVGVLLNNGDGTFGTAINYSAGRNPISIAPGDFNRDGRLDLAAANYNGADVTILFGNNTEMLVEDSGGTGLRIGSARGNLSNGNDVDYWSFTGLAGDRVNLAVDIPGNPPASSLYFRINRPDGSNWSYSDFTTTHFGWGQNSHPPGETALILPATGTYTIQVQFNHAYTGEYRFRLTLARPPIQVEREDNNAINQANSPELALTAGHQTATVLGYISIGDGAGDFYRLGNLANGTTIHLNLTQPASSGFGNVLGIYNPAGALVARSEIGAASLTYPVPEGADGTYYARVTEEGPSYAIKFGAADGFALNFDGVDDIVTTGVGLIPNSGEFTVEAWAYGLDMGGYREIISQGSGGNAFYLGYDTGNNIRSGDGWGSTGIPFPFHGWHHLAIVKSATDTKLYVDGVLRASRGGTIPNPAANTPFTIGKQYGPYGEYWPGGVDEVRVWNVARTAEEIQQNYASALTGNEAGLIGYWKFDEGSGTTLADASSQGQAGTIVGEPRWLSTTGGFRQTRGMYAQYLLSIDLADTLPPTITGDNLPAEGSDNFIVLDRFTLNFSEDMLASTVTDSASYELRSAGADDAFDTADDALYAVVSTGYSAGLSGGYSISNGPLQPGRYRFTAGTNLKDRAQNPLASPYVRQFAIRAVPGFFFESRDNNSRGTATSLSPAPGTGADGSVSTGGSYGAANNPYFVSAVLLNNDAFHDLVVANYGSDNISVLLGNGDGTFQTRVNYGAGNGPLGLGVVDLNGDTRLDVVTVNHNSHNVSILLGNGDGTFQAAVNYAVGRNPRVIAIGDLNGDNKLDLATANQGTANASVLIGNGDGTFQAAVNYATGNSPYGIVARDFNGDSKIDLAVSNQGSDNVTVMLGVGDGTFQAPVPYATPNAPRSLAAGDINADGKLDLVVNTSSNPNYVTVFPGNGDGSFAAGINYATGGSDPYHVVLPDLNGDSKLDVVVANYGSSRVSILLNNGDGTLGNALVFPAGRNPISIAPADFNRDGRLDLAAANYNSADVTILFGNNTEFLTEDPTGSGIRTSAGRGNVSSNADDDFWSFSAKAGDRLMVAGDIPGNPGASSLYYRIDRPDGNILHDFTTTHFGWGQSEPVVIPADGTYTLQVRFNHGYTGEYRFRVTLAAPPVQLENEDENNALASANKPLEGGLTQAKVLGYVSVGDPADFFSLGNLANGTTVNLGFTRPNSSRLAGVMKVFNASGNEVASSPAGAPALSFAVPAGADGAYYARVTAGTPGHAAGSTGSVSFDGSNDSADLGNWFNYQTFTISMWLRPRSTQQSYADIVDNNHRNGINWVVQQDVDRVNNYNWYAADGSAGVPFVLAPNVWQHLTVTRDSERVSKVYINGQLIGSTTGTGDINYDGNRFLRLARFGGGGRHWNGFMDEVAIWDRALNDAEVAATMNQRLAGTENGLLGYWGFNETSGTTASDATANARNATLVNGAFFAPLGTVEDADPGLFAQYILDINLADNVPPVVTGNSLPGEGSSLEVVVDRFTLTFSEDMLAQSVTNPASYDLRAAGPDELFGTPDDEIYAVAGSYSSGLTASFSIADGPLQPGLYRFSALTSLQDRAGNFLATPHVRQFTVAPISGSIFESRNNGTVDSATPLNPGLTPDPVGNNVRAVLGRGNIASTSDLDYWSFDAEAGDLMMLGADVPNNPANSSLHYRIERPNGSVLHEFDTANTGRGQSPPLTLAEAGAYRVRVSYNNQYFGEYRFRVWLTKPPMALENDENQGTGNGSVATASTLPLTTSGDNKTGSALGYLRATGDLDYFNLGTLTSGSTVYLNTRLLAGSQFNPVVSLYDASNGYRIEAGSGRADDGVAEVRIEQTGTYYAVVRGNAAGLRESYVLDVQVVPTGSVSFPNLQVTGITPPSGSIRSGQEVAFSFTVQNVGSVATPAPDWMDRVVVSQNDILGDADDTLIGIYPHNGALNPTDNYTVNQTGRLPDGINGPHYLIVQTDFGNAVNEFVLEADNVTVSTAFTVTRADYPDLKVENLTVTGPSVNNEFTINWTTANRGAAAANGGFKERLFVRNLRTGAILVNEPRDVASDLVAGATLPQSATVMTVVPGNYQVLVTTDSQNDFFEFDAVSHASAEQNTAEAGFAITQFFNVNVQPNPAEGGSVTGGGTFASGTSVTVTATPNTTDKPYRFLNWTENGLFQSANSSFTFTLGRDRNLVANFTLPLYAVTAANNPSAGGVVIGTGNVFHGNTATLTARPNAGYKFVNWTKDGTVVGTELTLSVVITGDYAVVANYEEANPFHDVTTATDPAGIAQVTGAGRYNNGQSVVISAPETITASPNVYTFRQFNLNGVRVSTSASFTKTFTTADPKDMAFVAVYDTRTILPTVANVTANMPNPVPLTATYQLDIRFDRSMDPAVAPAIVLDGPQQINVPGTGTWSSGVSGNDTYRTPNIAFSAGMDGTYAVKVSGGRDLSGGAVAEASVYTTIVDVTAPAHPTLTLGATSNSSATVNWADYAAPADLSGFRVYIQTATFDSTAGLTALTRLGANARSYQFGGLALDTQYYVAMAAVDNAGNSTPAIA